MDFGDDDPMALYCFAAESGDAVWNYPFPGDGYGSISGIATGDGKAFLGGTDGYLYAINLDDGSLAWRELIDPNPGYFGVSSSPLVYGEMVYALSNSDGILHVFNLDGTPQWTFETGGEVQYFASPAASGETLFVAGNQSSLFAVDLNTREELWNFSADGTVRSSPVIDPDSVYFSTTTGLYSLSKADGIENWNTSIDASLSTPALAEGFLYLGTKSGLSCFDITDGSVEWSFPGARIDVSPVVAGDLVYVATNEATGTVYAVDGTTGTEAWHHSQSAPPDANLAAYWGSSPAISGGMLFIGGEYWNTLTAFGTPSPSQDVIFDDTVTLTPGTFDLVPANNASASYSINRTSALGALHAAADAGGFDYIVNEYPWGLFVDAIGDYASDSVENFWLYQVTTAFGDTVSPNVGAADYECADGDIVTFYYGGWTVADATALVNVTVDLTDDIPGVPATGLSVNDGSRGGTVTAYVDLVADSGGWYAVVVSGVNGNGDSLAGIATARLSAGEELEMPVLIAVPHQAQTGTYTLYAGVYAFDTYPDEIIYQFGGVECDIS
jgi:outer membrane protein assembly factor BamB